MARENHKNHRERFPHLEGREGFIETMALNWLLRRAAFEEKMQQHSLGRRKQINVPLHNPCVIVALTASGSYLVFDSNTLNGQGGYAVYQKMEIRTRE